MARPGDLSRSNNSHSAANNYCGPRLNLSLKSLTRQVFLFRQALPQVAIHFAVKANPHPEVIQHLSQLGCGFEIASEGELNLLQRLNITPEVVIFSNPIKSPESIRAARDYGIRWFAFDTQEELEKLYQIAPLCHYELRLRTDGKDAVWPLSKKFGVSDSEALRLIRHAGKHKMPLRGLTFHVGSQCNSPTGWIDNIERCAQLAKEMQRSDLSLQLLNLGGGFPCPINDSVPSIGTLAKRMTKALMALPRDTRLAAEPGRFLAGPAGTLTCQVINTTERHGDPWMYLDCGYYNGLMELNEDFGFTLQSARRGALRPWTVAGPTCDSVDLFRPQYLLPQDVTTGDLIEIPCMGAYSNSCATEFNGFKKPEVCIDP